MAALGVLLADMGRRDEAHAAIEEAIELRRVLARRRPDAFLPDLASSLVIRVQIPISES